MGARPGMVAPKLEPISPSDGLEPGEYADLRLWVADARAKGFTLEQGYHKITDGGRTCRCRAPDGRLAGYFIQFRDGVYMANGKPKYKHEGSGWLFL